MRYLVPLVLSAWLVAALLGCESTAIWLLLIVPAAVAQAAATAGWYRRHHRRFG